MKKLLMITEILCSIGLLFSCIVLLIVQNTVSYETADTFEKTLKSNIFIVMDHNPTLGYLFLILGITLGFVGAVKLHYLMKERQSKKIPKTEYELFLENLLDRVKKEGVLVEVMPPGTPFVYAKHEQYKKSLGSVPVRNIWGNITNVYVIYEDFDGSIKYYDYPERTRKQAAKAIAERNMK